MSIQDTITETPGAPGGAAGAGKYLRVFKELRRDSVAVVRHGLRTQPLVDVYALDPFTAAVSADATVQAAPVHFYLYHRRDGTVGRDGHSIVVDDLRDPSFRIPFEAALREVGIRPDDDRHLGDLVVEFWKAFFDKPNDPFGEESYANSPWLDQDVGDRRSVAALRRGGDWDDLWLMYRPRKTINGSAAGGGMSHEWIEVFYMIAKGATEEAARYAEKLIRGGASGDKETQDAAHGPAAPPGVEVLQLGLETVGLRLLEGGPDRVAVMVLLRT